MSDRISTIHLDCIYFHFFGENNVWSHVIVKKTLFDNIFGYFFGVFLLCRISIQEQVVFSLPLLFVLLDGREEFMFCFFFNIFSLKLSDSINLQ